MDIQINDFNDLDDNGIWNSDEPLDTITITIIATEIDPLVGIEEINGFAEDVVITISAVIFDRATNPNIAIVTDDIDSYGELINVDQVDPDVGTVGAITSFSNDPVYSTSVDYYWNIDTDTITVTMDLPEDESLEGGTVQLEAKIGLSNFVDLGTLSQISANEFGDGDLELKTIVVPDTIIGLDNGVEELVDDFPAQDGSEIIIKAVVRDVAGNETTWTRNTTDGPHAGAVKIDLSPATIEITSETIDGWYMEGDTVNIQLQASEPIIIANTTLCTLSTAGLTPVSYTHLTLPTKA